MTFMALHPSVTSIVSMWRVSPVFLQSHTKMLKNLLLMVVWHKNIASLKPGMPDFALASEDAFLVW